MNADGHTLSEQDTAEFLDRYGDLIDDRLADVVQEVVAELVAEQLRGRQRNWLPVAALCAAVTGISVLLRHTPSVVVVLWIVAAFVCGCWSVRFRRYDAVAGGPS